MRIGRLVFNFRSPIRIHTIPKAEYDRVKAWQEVVDQNPGSFKVKYLILDGGNETVHLENGKVISVR